jgi:hypothetical protein
VRGDGDDLPPLVARPLRRTEVDADDHLDLGCAAKETNGTITLQFSPLPPPWSRTIRAAKAVEPPARARTGTARSTDLAEARDHDLAREVRSVPGGHRSSLLASLRPDDQQAPPRRARRSC